ncbi:MAG: peptidoglycan-associated lipoprotein Pal [Deltaproteobacteria bacterium]|nr:peptidoglycan-associated lipoprotein Pal [Deltaproteobacteria bacterium]
MKKKALFVWMVLVIACSSLLLMTSCAKKQIGAGEAEGMQEQPAVTEEAEVPSDEGYAEREKQRQAELEALRQKQLEIDAFESVNIYFDFDKSELKPESQIALKNKAAWLENNPEYSVRIEGHCDERGTNEYNLALGERRANAAANFLMSLGISGDRIRTISYGEERPADPRHNETAWARNRRDEFKLFK